ncbi:MAG: sigma-54 interaction domain-containing protein [Desulfonatronovibrionaceae bacterium]
MDNPVPDSITSGFLSQILDSMAEGVFTLDTSGTITSWNRAMEKITGYSRDEALGRPCSILNFSSCMTHACPRDINECKILKKGSCQPRECLLTARNGQSVLVIKQAAIVRSDEGKVLGIVETLTDLTELEKARQKADEASLLLARHYGMNNIVGDSRPMRRVFHRIRAAAASRATVLIQGETGTGKEMVASAIHYNSRESHQPFVTINCSALSETLLESELFGHVKGAFTGAIKDRQGRFEDADGGTIFLDEVGDLSPAIQVKLLRVLQERQIERVGDSRSRPVDIRVITATNRNIKELVKQGIFREDLYYRLKVFPIYLPPLRDRKKDIPLLVDHFVRQQNRISRRRIRGVNSEAMRLFMLHDWPGNVRELENAIQHAFVICGRNMITAADLPEELTNMSFWAEPHALGKSRKKELQNKKPGLDRAKLWQLLENCGWNKAEVGRQLGVSRTAVWKYMKKLDIPLRPPE